MDLDCKYSPTEMSLYYLIKNLKPGVTAAPANSVFAHLNPEKLKAIRAIIKDLSDMQIPAQNQDVQISFLVDTSIPKDPNNPNGHTRTVILIPPHLKDYAHKDAKKIICCDSQEDKILGEGNQKVCHLGIDILSGQRYAVAKYFKRQEKEIYLLERTRGLPQIVRLEHSVISFTQPPLAIFKYYNAGDLRSFIYNFPGAFQNPDNKFTLFKDIVQAVHQLHAKNIIHQDIKPENFLIDISNKPHAVLSDLGLACPEERLKRSSACGTPFYIAPELSEVFQKFLIRKKNKAPLNREEQQQWATTVSTKSDIWALGLVLLSFFSNYPSWIPEPVKKDETLRISWMQKLSEMKAPSFKKPQRGTFLYLVWKMLQINPEKRISAHSAYLYLENLEKEKKAACAPINLTDFQPSLKLKHPVIYPPEINYDLYETYVQNLKNLPIQWEHGEDDIYKLAHALVKESDKGSNRFFIKGKQHQELVEGFDKNLDPQLKIPQFPFPVFIYEKTPFIKFSDQMDIWCNLVTGEVLTCSESDHNEGLA
jgi:serine/threonine protein kinase